MEIKLCRICGHNGYDFIHIFKTEGLKNKIETCLPILVSPHCLLPETICPECLKTIENFYIFLKNCLQKIIILESQLDIQESCLKTKRKKDKSCSVALSLSDSSKFVQTEDYLNVLIGNNSDFKYCDPDFPLTSDYLNRESKKYSSNNILVDYEVLSDTNSNDFEDSSTPGQVIFGEKIKTLNHFNNIVDNILCKTINTNFDGHVNKVDASDQSLISEITERKSLKKRRGEIIENSSTKIYKLDSGNKRKCTKPKKVEKAYERNEEENEKDCKVTEIKREIDDDFDENIEEKQTIKQPSAVSMLHETCLLCNTQIGGSSSLAEHFVTVHAKEFPQRNTEILLNGNGEVASEKKKKNLPSLVKISDLKRSESIDDGPISENYPGDLPSTILKITCVNCPTAFTTKTELFVHFQLKHSEISTYLCGICLLQVNSVANLKSHVQICSNDRPISTRYYCEVCCFGEDNYRCLESHVLIHNFLLENCRKEVKNFDPEDYILKNPRFEANASSPIKNFSCLECSRSDFDSFRKFSVHRRDVHSIYHCDLCNKFYGRNSHLWKHVHRLHKGHPSITCQICFKTSASKYHLAQHFIKVHQLKTVVKKEEDDPNLAQKFSDVNSGNTTNRSLKKQDSTTDQEHQNSSYDENSLNQYSQSENDNSLDAKIAPKEIDPSHDLYTNILTNYTPPKNEGDFKCPKCSKGFHKRMLLRKHKKNCRPKLQKDLLTRCKSCARIFKDRQSLAKHLINYHSDYVCEICSEKVPSKCEIVTHIRFQHPSSHLVCSVCENILRCKKDLLEHLADHENSYVCQFCGDTLSSKVKLKMHILSLHRKILSLSCGICLKLFENQHVLRNHVTLVHKDQLDPLTSCPICGKNYGSKWKTFDHVNKSHGRIFKACKICLEIYETELQLESHIKTAHITQQIPMNSSVKPNPAAILSTPIKSVGTSLNLNNNQNDFESDSEENTEETENNTQSSDSGDEENSRPDQLEDQKQVVGKNSLNFPSQENKISLLEKRLIGKTVTHRNAGNEKSAAVNSHKQFFIGSSGAASRNVIADNKKENTGLLKIKKEDDIISDKKSDSNPLIHHSKRTVYVNSNDPSFCEICHKTWPAKKHLWQHYIRCHKKIAATVCGICLKTNKNYESLQIHLRETHPTLLHGQGFGSNFICRVCGRYHNASSKLSLHMVIHENFDWKLLDRFPPILRYQSNVKNLSKQNGQKRNGNGEIVNRNGLKYEQIKVKKEIDSFNENDEMYDDMIEQVEESSTSSETETGNKAQDSSSDSEDNNVISAQSHDNSFKNKVPQTSENTLSFSNLLQTLKNHNQFQILNQIRKDSLLNVANPLENTSKTNILKDTSKNISSKVLSNVHTDSIHYTEHRYAVSSNISNALPKSSQSVKIPSKISNTSPYSKISSLNSNTYAQNSEYMEHSYLSEESSSSMSDCEQDAGQEGLQGDQNDGGQNSQSSAPEDGVSRESQDSDTSGDEVVEQDGGASRNLLRPKPEELDSAIKSISDPCTEPPVMTDYNDFSEPMQTNNCLNDTEIENAVGSIL